MEPNEYGHYPWRSTTTVTDHLGARIQIAITEPRAGLWSAADRRDAAEIAAHLAHKALEDINKNRREKEEECPF